MTTRSLRSHVARVALLAAFLATPYVSRADYAAWKFDASAQQARMFDDWLMQDEPNAESRARLFTASSDGVAELALVDRVLTELRELDAADSALDARRDALASAKASGADARWKEFYRTACEARRRARLADAMEEAPQFVYTKHYVMGASHYAYTEDVTDEAYKDYSVNRQPGGQLCLATFDENGGVSSKVLVETSTGTIRDPDVSYDGKRVLFSMRTSLDQDDFHLYEHNVETGETKQLTFGLGVADIEPCYLPTGDILFISTRCGQNTDCWWTEVSNLYTCDGEGRFLRRVSVDQVTVNYPKPLDDGRVVYTRWDYNDRGHVYVQPLFQMNADGTGQTEFYGNNSYFPTSLLHPKGVPGTDKVVAIASGHHTYQQGKLILIDRSKGTQANLGATLIAPTRETANEEKVDRYGQEGELFQYPHPLDESSLLCAYLPEGSQERTYAIPYGVYWFDFDGRRELLAYDPAISCGQPAPLVPREIPTLRASQVDLAKTTGTYYVQDVYEGPGLTGIERGTIKRLRVVELLFRPFGVGWNWNWGEAGDSIVTSPISIGNGTWDAKRVLGEVPVEEDGSAYFEVPAMTPVYFQLLDENGDVAQTMRSWSTLQPGETFGCVGCHEPKGSVIENVAATGATTAALRKGVAKLTPVLSPPPGKYQNAGFDYVRDVQPILDHYCVSCHTGGELEDGRPAPFSLLGNEEKVPSEERKEIYDVEQRRLSESYLNLTQNGRHEGRWVRWLGIQDRPSMLEPYHWGAAKSPLITMFRDENGVAGGQDENHRDVKIDEASLRTLAMWIDLLVPYLGDYYELNRWSPGDRAYYRYYLNQRERNAAIVRDNIDRKIKSDASGVLPDPSEFEQFDVGGPEYREKFVSNLLTRKVPSLASKSGAENVYRNLALNPYDIQGDDMDVALYPHASSNSEYAWADCFAAKNAIDGKSENRGHGDAYPSWGPNLRTDLWLNVDFGCEVEIDKAVVYLRADFPHDGVWTRGTLEFSDGSTEEIEFRETSEPQVFTFAKRRASSVKLTNLQAPKPLKWSGVTEIEFWGVSVEEDSNEE
ncbi:MAG: hypothetical protein IJU03_03210 [Thermoguttaceae bacterium]|nr:hypothetical protein [Thermoguttaceae bacterium]